MENRLSAKLMNKINYNSYKIIQEIGLPSSAVNIFSSFLFSSEPTISNTLLLAGLCQLGLTTLLRTGELKDLKDIKEIRDIYDNVIKNYIKVNKIFDLNTPVELYTMFDYCLHNGYLSRNKEYKARLDNVKDVMPIIGSNILAGKGVCRHISCMFRDVLNEAGFENEILGVYLGEGFILDYLKNKISSVIDEEELSRAKIQLEQRTSNNDYLLKNQDDANHVINFVTHDGQKYFLDATNSRMYNLNPERDLSLCDNYDEFIKIYFESSLCYNRKCDLDELRRQILFYSENQQENEEKRIATFSICKTNTDLFEKFYRENQEAYDEVSEKLARIKVKKHG